MCVPRIMLLAPLSEPLAQIARDRFQVVRQPAEFGSGQRQVQRFEQLRLGATNCLEAARPRGSQGDQRRTFVRRIGSRFDEPQRDEVVDEHLDVLPRDRSGSGERWNGLRALSRQAFQDAAV